MSLLNELGFTGRFNTIKIGVLIDTLKTTLSIQAVINNLLEEGVEFLILDVKKGYLIRDSYFDIIIADRYILEKNISLNQFYSLTLGGCLLLHTIDDSNYFNLLPLKFQGRVTVFYESFQITYNGILYQGE